MRSALRVTSRVLLLLALVSACDGEPERADVRTNRSTANAIGTKAPAAAATAAADTTVVEIIDTTPPVEAVVVTPPVVVMPPSPATVATPSPPPPIVLDRRDGAIDKVIEVRSRTETDEAPVKLTLAQFAAAVPSAGAAVLGSNADALVLGYPTEIRRQGAAGPSTAAGAYPVFFGNRDQLLLRVAVLTDGAEPAAWYFYDESIDPKYERALPAFVFDGAENARPNLTDTGWQAPPAKDAGVLFANERVLWVRLDQAIIRLSRSGNRWRISKIPLTEGERAMSYVAASEAMLVLMSAGGDTRAFGVGDDRVTLTASRLPDGFAGDKTLFLPLGAWDVALGAAGALARKRGEEVWHVVANAPKPDVASVRLVHVYDKKAFVVMAGVGYLLTLDDGAGAVSPPVAVGGIPQAVLDIGTASCEACHSLRSAEPTYVGAGRFDYRNLDHWKAFVTQRGEVGAADYVLNDMCARLSTSTCKTADAARRSLQDFILALLNQP